jgi:hypothetical protein
MLTTLALGAVLAALPGAFAWALPGNGDDGRCDGRLPTKAERAAFDFESKVGSAQQLRSGFKMPSDRALVEQMLRDPAYAGSIRQYQMALTADEARYMVSRLDLQRTEFTAPITDYFERNAGAYYSFAIVDDFPRDAYFAVYVKDPERHAQALVAISPRIRIFPIAVSREALEAANQRVNKGRAQLETEGIHVWGWGPSTDRNTVEVWLISARPDAAAIVESRLRPYVKANVTDTRLSHPECVSATGYWGRRGRRTLDVAWKTGGGSDLVSIGARESARTVRIRIIERQSNGPVPAILIYRHERLRLRRPLGGREVVDAETGRPLKRLSEREARRRFSRRRAR